MGFTNFNGSPKRDASDTMHITRAFSEGMSEIGENPVYNERKKTISMENKNEKFMA